MKTVRCQVKSYIQFRQQLGHKLLRSEKILSNFASFLENGGHPYITIELAVAFSKKNHKASSSTWSMILGTIRLFALFLKTIDERTEVPPKNMIPGAYQRATPYIYTEDEIQNLLSACSQLVNRSKILQHTYRVLFGLVAVTGMRISEAIHLKQVNIDVVNETITVKKTKFRKSRIIPLHTSTLSQLKDYIDLKSAFSFPQESLNLFVSSEGKSLRYHNIRKAFVRASVHAGLRDNLKGHGPRMHDLRHTFAVQTLTEWSSNLSDVHVNLPLLSTYLGHVNPANTYWYFTATPELLRAAANKLESNIREEL